MMVETYLHVWPKPFYHWSVYFSLLQMVIVPVLPPTSDWVWHWLSDYLFAEQGRDLVRSRCSWLSQEAFSFQIELPACANSSVRWSILFSRQLLPKHVKMLLFITMRDWFPGNNSIWQNGEICGLERLSVIHSKREKDFTPKHTSCPPCDLMQTLMHASMLLLHIFYCESIAKLGIFYRNQNAFKPCRCVIRRKHYIIWVLFIAPV